MEEELKCPACKHFLNNPVLLPCYHSLCLNCALHAQQQIKASATEEEGSIPENECPEPDKVSLLSETDSGVVCTSRPNSYVGTPILFPPPLLQANALLSLGCPVCHKVVYFDENGAQNLPRNRALQNIVDKYSDSHTQCQLCEAGAREASVMCEQCEVFYCEACREACHPARGPLAKHALVTPAEGRALLRQRAKCKEPRCADHADEALSMYCMLCKTPVCIVCLQEGRHASHDVQALGAMCKAQKTELSQNLQALSERAKSATEFIQGLKVQTEAINETCTEVEAAIAAHCAVLQAALDARKARLVEFARRERDSRVKHLREQVAASTAKLQQTTGLLQFCIEALKEVDPTAFLQIGTALVHRVSTVDLTWPKDMSGHAWPPGSDFHLTLDYQSVLQGIEHMTFSQMKPPGPPQMIPEECVAENNSITIAWQPQPTSFVEGYVLELDDSEGSNFKEVYCGKETICTVDGLHFNSTYKMRVKAFNSSGEGPCSDVITLHTAEVAWFSFDGATAPPDVVLTNENQTAACESYEHRVVLGSLGFSRGAHYWEVSVDKYVNDTDPAFGVALFDVSRDTMLGKDSKGWSMYIDHQRSWFLHGDTHDRRTEGGVGAGSVVGVLLDLDRGELSFFVNDERQGPPAAFQGLTGNVFFPAVSLNRNVQLTLHTGLDPPTSLPPPADSP